MNIHFTPHFSSQFSFLTLFNFSSASSLLLPFSHTSSHKMQREAGKTFNFLIMFEITNVTSPNSSNSGSIPKLTSTRTTSYPSAQASALALLSAAQASQQMARVKTATWHLSSIRTHMVPATLTLRIRSDTRSSSMFCTRKSRPRRSSTSRR